MTPWIWLDETPDYILNVQSYSIKSRGFKPPTSNPSPNPAKSAPAAQSYQ